MTTKRVSAPFDLTSDRTVIAEEKYQKKTKVTNYNNQVILSNEEHVIHVRGWNRRHVIMRAKEERLSAEKATALAAVPPQAIANLMFNVDLSDFNPEKFEKTALHTEQVLLSMTKVEKFWHHCLLEGRICDGWHGKWHKGHEIVKTKVFREYEYMPVGQFVKGPKDNIQFFKQSWKLFPLSKGLIKLKNSPHNSIVLDCSREEAMKCFNASMNEEIFKDGDWLEDEDSD
eukprot:COSAG04_NODE_1312_length_7264_cov_6.349058_6_plen_229_part_00